MNNKLIKAMAKAVVLMATLAGLFIMVVAFVVTIRDGGAPIYIVLFVFILIFGSLTWLILRSEK